MPGDRIYDAKWPLPVHDVLKASEIEDVSSETVSFIKMDGTADAGEAAGTIVYAQLDKSPVLNKLGDRVGRFDGTDLDSSISFADGVILAAGEKGFVTFGSGDERLTKTAAKLTTNGDWALDYQTGIIVLKKASTATSLSVSYKIKKPYVSTSSSGGDTPTGSVSDPYGTQEVNPLDTKNVAILQKTETGEASGTTTNNYIDVRNYNKIKVQFEKTGGAGTQTHTIEASCQDDGTAPGSCLYQDISQYGISPLSQAAGAATYTADILYEIDVKGLSYVNLKTVSSVDTVNYGIYARVAY